MEQTTYCEECGREVDANRVKWLEKNLAGEWNTTGDDLPEEESLGWFPVGQSCYGRIHD